MIMLLGFFSTPILLYNLGVSGFGLYAVVTSLQAYFGVLDLGIGASLSRFMVIYGARADQESVARITTFGVIFYVAAALILLPVVHLVAPTFILLIKVPLSARSEVALAIDVMFLLFICSSMFGVISSRLYALGRMDLITTSNVLGAVSATAAMATILPRFPHFLVAIACLGSSVFVTSGANWLFLKKTDASPVFRNPFSLPKSLLRELFSFGTWSQVNNLTAVINLEADKVIISRLLGISAVASYQVANRYALLSRALPLQLLGALFPAVTARLAAPTTTAELSDLYSENCRLLMLATLSIVGFLAAISHQFLLTWIGRSLPGSDALIYALLISYSVNNLTGLGTTIVRAKGRPEIETIYAVGSALLNIVATLILATRYGLWGVVGGTILGNVVGSIGFLLIFHRWASLSFRETVLGWLIRLITCVAFAGVVTSVLIHVIPFTKSLSRVEQYVVLGFMVVPYGICMALSMLITKFLTQDEIRLALYWLKRAARALLLHQEG